MYDLVTDIRRTGEWSPICRACRWQDGDGLREGAWFFGHNEAEGQVWETESQVAVADRGHEFVWLVGGKYARWSYRFEPVAGGGTRLTEGWEFLAEGRAMFRGEVRRRCGPTDPASPQPGDKRHSSDPVSDQTNRRGATI